MIRKNKNITDWPIIIYIKCHFLSPLCLAQNVIYTLEYFKQNMSRSVLLDCIKLYSCCFIFSPVVMYYIWWRFFNIIAHHFCRTKNLQTESQSGQVISLWWQSTTSSWLQRGNMRRGLIKWLKDQIILITLFNCRSQAAVYGACLFLILQGQRDPTLWAFHSGSVLPDQCAGHGAFDFKLRVSNKTVC